MIMKITEESNILMSFFVKNNCLLPLKQSNKTDSILQILYNDIKNGVSYINSIKTKMGNSFYNLKIKHITNIKQISKPVTFPPNSFTEEVRKYIDENIVSSLTYNFNMFDRNITIIFLTEDNNISSLVKIYNNYVDYMLVWLYIADIYSSKKCVAQLKIFIYHTSLLKALPKSNIEILDQNNVNTGFSMTCPSDSEIVLFRKEEWIKVFIHETFHAYNLTISPLYEQLEKYLFNVYGLNIEYNIGESYAEFWARIINICFLILNSQTKYNKNQFIIEFEKYLDLERGFSLLHAIKVLNHNDMTIQYFYQENKDNNDIIVLKQKYSENTSVFSYYVIASLLLINSSEMFEWCYNNNDVILEFKNNEKNIINFISFINKCLNTVCVKSYIKNINLWLNKESNKNEKNGKTLRMSINEWIY